MNFGFSENDLGVGGISVVVPRARSCAGGSVSRYVRRYVPGREAKGNTFCELS